MQQATKQFDVIVIGAGAAGLMCSALAGQGGRRVLLLDKANKVGKKILMSGGGRCNFTNLNVTPDNYLSHNPHFCKSALSRYTQWDFIALVDAYRIEYHEKTLGQLFCTGKAQHIVDMLLAECDKGRVTIALNQIIINVQKVEQTFLLTTNNACYQTSAVVVASGGLSIPTMGASAFGYELAKQFGLNVWPTRAGLVPYTLHTEDKARFASLAGIAVRCMISCHGQSFTENILFTHRGLSGPAVLQMSSYWRAGDPVVIQLLPELDVRKLLNSAKLDNREQQVKTILAHYLPKRLLEVLINESLLQKPLKQLETSAVDAVADCLQNWQLKPNGTEGYRTAEVTIGGVDCNAISSKTFAAKKVPGLYFIGEVLDVTGWLGGYNFQWAWSSASACAQALCTEN